MKESILYFYHIRFVKIDLVKSIRLVEMRKEERRDGIRRVVK